MFRRLVDDASRDDAELAVPDDDGVAEVPRLQGRQEAKALRPAERGVQLVKGVTVQSRAETLGQKLSDELPFHAMPPAGTVVANVPADRPLAYPMLPKG